MRKKTTIKWKQVLKTQMKHLGIIIIHSTVLDFENTKTLFNLGFSLRKPEETYITK